MIGANDADVIKKVDDEPDLINLKSADVLTEAKLQRVRAVLNPKLCHNSCNYQTYNKHVNNKSFDDQNNLIPQSTAAIRASPRRMTANNIYNYQAVPVTNSTDFRIKFSTENHISENQSQQIVDHPRINPERLPRSHHVFTAKHLYPVLNSEDEASVSKNIVDEFDPLVLNIAKSNVKSKPEKCQDVIRSPVRRNSESDEVGKIVETSFRSTKFDDLKDFNVEFDVSNVKFKARQSETEKRLMKLVTVLRDKIYSESDESLAAIQKWARNVIISPRVTHPLPNGLTSIKLSVKKTFLSTSAETAENFEDQSIVFTCDVDSPIEQIVAHVFYALDEISQRRSDENPDNFALKVSGLDEFLLPLTRLSDYAYVHNCAKFDKDVSLDFVAIPDYADEKSNTEEIQFSDENTVKVADISITFETFLKELYKFINQIAKHEYVQASGVKQSIRMLSVMLHNILPFDLANVLEQLCDFGQKISEKRKTKQSIRRASGVSTTTDDVNCRLPDVAHAKRLAQTLFDCVLKFVKTYVESSTACFDFIDKIDNEQQKLNKEISDLEENFIVRIESVHNIDPSDLEKYESFYVVSYLMHGVSELSSVLKTENAQVVNGKDTTEMIKLKEHSQMKLTDPSTFLRFDAWLTFDRNLICTLPRESRLCLILYGTRIEEVTENSNVNGQSSQSEPHIRSITEVQLCWTTFPLFDTSRSLVQGSNFLSTSNKPTVEPYGPHPCLSESNKYLPVFLVQFPSFDLDYNFPQVYVQCLPNEDATAENSFTSAKPFDSLDIDQQQLLEDIIRHGSLDIDDKELLWEKRFYLAEKPEAFHLVLRSSMSWDWAFLTNIYALIPMWKALTAGQALGLLMPEFPDDQIRKAALKWLESSGPDECCDILPQLTEALSYETYDDSHLSELLLRWSVENRRFAYNFFWQLEERLDRKNLFSRRCAFLQISLFKLLGAQFQQVVLKQKKLINKMDEIAAELKNCRDSERKQYLTTKMCQLDADLLSNHVNLPLFPSVVAAGIDWQRCKFFNSLTLPIKFAFRTVSPNAVYDVMNKLGDDLRQDSFVLQMMRLMDSLWLKENLDLRMLIYQCLSTGHKKGIIEIVPNCVTLREIHVLEGGVTGALKDNMIGKWLQKQSATELDYLSALNNFRRSCAGWCVGTFILGIGDRHNDNIMLTSRGHVFHIDFGKYLGETENFGSFKRDRTPFILTSDMVDVINCGETKSTPYFQDFVDYCCRAFNVVRNNYALFINLMSLMLKANVPGLTEDAVKYVCANLWLDHSDSEASVRFTRMIEECMNNRFPKWNFLVHTLAQQRKAKSGRSDIFGLSFIPKVYSAESDGRISTVKLIGCEKWRIPEKVYMYKIQVDRENVRVPSYIYRSYKEIDEFSECLCLKFPSCKLPILPKDRGLGRTNVRSIAEHRTGYVFGFLSTLFNADDELAHSDLTYTFFHSILRDEQSSNFGRPETGLERDPDNTYQNQIRGELKLCIEYKKRCLEIFVQHARNLALVSATVPDSYVKCYLRPDINRRSKRKTRIIRRSQNPTYNETLLYPWTWDTLNDKTLEISVWHSDVIRENAFIGGVQLDVKELLSTPNKRISRWFTLGNITTGQSFHLS